MSCVINVFILDCRIMYNIEIIKSAFNSTTVLNLSNVCEMVEMFDAHFGSLEQEV